MFPAKLLNSLIVTKINQNSGKKFTSGGVILKQNDTSN